MAPIVDDKVVINVIGLGGSKNVKVPAVTTVGDLKAATGLDGTVRINGQNTVKDKDTVELKKGDMVSKEMPKVSHG